VAFAVVIEVDNSGEDPEEGRRGLRDELAPVLRGLPGFQSAQLMAAHERGLGFACVVFETREQADELTGWFTVGAVIRPGVTVVRTEVIEVVASA
jgi:hypothetical protein